MRCACRMVTVIPDVSVWRSRSWRGACRHVEPAVAELRRDGFRVRTIDVDHDQDSPRHYSIRSLPTFVYVVDGQEVRREIGAVSSDELRSMWRSPDALTAFGVKRIDCDADRGCASRPTANCLNLFEVVGGVRTLLQRQSVRLPCSVTGPCRRITFSTSPLSVRTNSSSAWMT